MSLTLDRLQELLRADAIECDQRQAKERALAWQTKSVQSAITETWRAQGILERSDEATTAMLPMPLTIFQTPLSGPQTTILLYETLPRRIQGKLKNPPSGGNGIVEVPIAYLDQADETGDDNILTHNRRRVLGGNLTNKLSEYTRGAAGQTRPFRPGGLGQVSDVDNEVDEYRTAEAMARSQRVLEQDEELSWKDGSLITAPPGVDFKVGLSWIDVVGGDGDADTAGAGVVTKPQEPEVEAFSSDVSQTQNRMPSTPTLFSKAFFDDDSLFGSTSSEDSGDSVSDHAGPDEDEDVTEIKVDSSDLVDRVLKAVDEVSAEPHEVDSLLRELTMTSTQTYRGTKMDVLANPLHLTERAAEDQKNESRKSWAVTKLLPIRDFEALIPNPALKFPFTLDGFQQQAVARLERSESVFIAAHTSAGKTVVAEYAVALATQRATRCIYTSPIKALSNQKFRDFSLKFGSDNVGLVTGDLQINVDDSTCLIMTTEILRSMLYRGADLIRDIEWVVFDEVHYVNDTERGVVWEEVIIMLPPYVNLIFLSATTPNTIEFSDWIGRTKRKPVHVIRTDYRPVPLSHHLWAGSKLHKILEGRGSFLDQGYKEAADALLPPCAKDPKKKADQKGRPPSRQATGAKDLAWQAQGTKQNWVSLVRFLDRELLTPTVVFTFSKKKCEEVANMLRSLDLNTAKERSAVQAFSLQTVARLSQSDANLPQVLLVCEMVQRGIGVHHGGLLPILKEMVEILFSKNLIKVLFATETFAMGVNMPARSVVFNSIRKHDGAQFRVIEPGEYTQMAGRAGRRGLDEVGTVIICCFGDQPIPSQILRSMLTGTSTRLQSNFRLRYNMVLNLLRTAALSVESMIARSFSEFATQRALTANEYPLLLAKGTATLEKLDSRYSQQARVGAEDLDRYYALCQEILTGNGDILSYVKEFEGSALSEVLQPGRLLLVTAMREHGCVRAPAVVLRNTVLSMPGGSTKQGDHPEKIVCMLLMPPSAHSADYSPSGSTERRVGYVGLSLQRVYSVKEIRFSEILLVTSVKANIDPRSIVSEDTPGSRSIAVGSTGSASSGRNDANMFAGMKAFGKKSLDDAGPSGVKGDEAVEKAMRYLLDAEKSELFEGPLPSLDLRTFLRRGTDVMKFRQLCDLVDEKLVLARSCSSHRHPTLERFYLDVERKEALREKVNLLRHLLSNESLNLFPDYLQRKTVLKKLGYIDHLETVSVKGRVACEVNTCDELILTEMVFEGILNDLQPEEIAAVLSSLVFQEKRGDDEFDSEMPARLVTCCEQMKRIALNLGLLQKSHGLKVDPNEYSESSLCFGLVHVVYEWALGVPFKNICDLTDVQEGSIVRCITRLDELCREVRNCARIVGNPTLYRKLENASTSIKRDIVFASSLYVS